MGSANHLEKLPERCYAVNGVTGKIIILERGTSGYYATSIITKDAEESESIAAEFNERLGVTKAQAAAMYAGSMFGFDVPAADPDNYNEYGRLKESGKESLYSSR